MTIPGKNASAIELVEFFRDYNRNIHNVMLEGGDYKTLIDDLMKIDFSNDWKHFDTAMISLHTNKIRYYADTRDITHEVEYAWDKSDECENDLLKFWEELEDSINASCEDTISKMYKDVDIDSTTPAIKYIKKLEDMLNYVYEGKPLDSMWKLKECLLKMEQMYIDTTTSLHLPLYSLSPAEKKILVNSDDTEEIVFLICKIFDNWRKDKNGKIMEHSIAKAMMGSSYKINQHLERMGIYRKQYYRFLAEGTFPTRKLVLGLALYFVPNDILRIEELMNMFGYSIKSNLTYISKSDDKKYLRDSNLCKMITAGLDTDIIIKLISESSNEVKKSSSSKNFS